jgi:hypothetical protein
MISLYDLRSMLKVVETLPPVRTFVKDTFFKKGEVSLTDAVDIDIIKGKRKLAPFVSPLRQGKLVERDGYTTRTFKPAYVKPKMITTVDDILKRLAGEQIYTNDVYSKMRDLASARLAKDLQQLNTMITRREEWMACKAITEGSVPVVGDGVNDSISYLFDSSQLPVFSGTARWNQSTTCTPIADLKRLKRERVQKSFAPNICIMGTGAIDNFLKADEVIGNSTGGKNLFNMTKVNIGQIDIKILPEGVTYYGRLEEVGLDLYSYEEWVVNPLTDALEPLIPENAVILGSTQALATFNYGAIKDLSCLNPYERFPKSWEEEDPSVRYLMLQSAPLPILNEADAWVSARVY